MRRIQSGDDEAFARFVDRYQKRFYRTAYSSLRDPEEALDATQEAFMKIYRARLDWKPDASPGTWAYRILLNHCIDRTRRRKLRDMKSLDARRDAGAPDPVDPRASALEEAERMQKRARIDDAVSLLSERQRLIVTLRHANDLSLEEIADLLGCSTGTVKSTLHRAIAKLRTILTPQLKEGALE